MSNLPNDLTPSFRLANYGHNVLSEAELLAIMLGQETTEGLTYVNELLAYFDGLRGLYKAGFHELALAPGMTPKRAAKLLASLEIGKRLAKATPDERIQVRSPADVANLVLLEMGLLDVEHMRVAITDNRNYILKIVTLYVGSLGTAVIRYAELFREAIKLNGAGIILIHNHPSGDPTPSPEDITVTQGVVELGDRLDITVLDHIIIGRNRYISLKERGLGFK